MNKFAYILGNEIIPDPYSFEEKSLRLIIEKFEIYQWDTDLKKHGIVEQMTSLSNSQLGRLWWGTGPHSIRVPIRILANNHLKNIRKLINDRTRQGLTGPLNDIYIVAIGQILNERKDLDIIDDYQILMLPWKQLLEEKWSSQK